VIPIPINVAYNIDCMEYMKTLPDKAFDLAIVDPPYGINMDGGKIGGDNKGRTTDYIKKTWDKKAPEDEYFVELLRVSKNQIIFGANHFISRIPFDSPCWIVWDKDNTGNFADCELAWTSFKSAVRKYKFRWNGMLQGNMKNKEKRIHPTQKPVALYEWLLRNYAKPGDKILDTHLGSGSSRIAAYNLGFDFVGCEIDPDYFKAQEERFAAHTAQMNLFIQKS
jgi:site-specific DNA-methyltransferase (adenine-specific)